MEFWSRSALDNFEVNHTETWVPVPSYRAVRSKRHLYVEYNYEDGSTEGELYDLIRDPRELTNIYSRAAPELLRAFAKHAEQLQACAGARCRVLEDAPPEGL